MRADPPMSRTESPASPITILLVEDEESVRCVTQRLLESRGYEVVTAIDGREGVATYTSDPERFDLVMVDRNMPDLDGIGVLAQIRNIDAEVPTLLTSGTREAIDDIPAESAPTGFLMKPYGVGALQEAVQAALAG